MGPDVVITGSAVFDEKTPKENAKFMLEAIGKKLWINHSMEKSL